VPWDAERQGREPIPPDRREATLGDRVDPKDQATAALQDHRAGAVFPDQPAPRRRLHRRRGILGAGGARRPHEADGEGREPHQSRGSTRRAASDDRDRQGAAHDHPGWKTNGAATSTAPP
jgi:hypothetical protein